MGSGPHDLIRLVVDTEVLFQPQVIRNETEWSITYRIPFSFIRRLFPQFTAEPGATIRANFYKCADNSPVVHYLSWSPMDTDIPQFHRPVDFGLLTFA